MRPTIPGVGTAQPANRSTPDRAVKNSPASHGPENDSASSTWRDAFVHPIPTPPLSLGYRLGLLLAAGAMLILPGIYFAFIALVAWLVYWHAVNDADIFSYVHGSGETRGAFLIYVFPLFVGITMLVFLIKPLFSRQRDQQHPLILTRNEQPLFFEFVDRLARFVGAPSPRQIEVDVDVNAHARFRNGLISSISGSDLVLRVGLPLVSNLSMPQLAGVLAHELGHFAQRGGMTLTYIVRSINSWFARMVYQRDRIDEMLDSLTHNGGHYVVAFAALVAKGFVWLARRLLWCLMMLGHAIASLMLRQMEFDADRYQTLVAGSENYARTMRALAEISVATHAAYELVSDNWREKRLPDDLPALVAVQHRDRITPEIRNALEAASAKEKTGWLDTHPSTRDRIAAATRLNSAGVLPGDAPATTLFRDYAELAKRATLARYFEVIGREVRPEHLAPVEGVVQAQQAQADNFRAMSRFMQDVIHPAVLAGPHRLPPTPATPDALDRAMERLLELRTQLRESAGAARTAIRKTVEADELGDGVRAVRALRLAGIQKVDAKRFGLTKTDEAELTTLADRSAKTMTSHEPSIRHAQRIAIERLELALSLESTKTQPAIDALPLDEPSAEDDFGEYAVVAAVAPDSTGELISLIAQLDGQRANVRELTVEVPRTLVLLQQLKPGQIPEALAGAIVSRAKRLGEICIRLLEAMPATPYPFAHTARSITVREFIADGQKLSGHENPIETFEFARALVGRFFDLYGRVLAELVQRAEKVESHLGLSPLDVVPDDDAKPVAGEPDGR